MAPQQNSTLIDDNLEVCPSLLNLPEEINRYSPILPLKNKENLDKNNNNNNNCYQHQDVNVMPKWEQTEREQRHYHKYKHHRSGSNRSGHSRRSRSISLYGVNSTMIRLSLKHHKDIQDPSKALKTNTTLSSIRDYICKLLSFGKSKKRNAKSKKCNKSVKSSKSKRDEKENQLESNDLMLLLNPNTKCSDQQKVMNICAKNVESNVKSSNIKPTTEESEIQAKTKINKEKLYKLSETRSTIRKRRAASRRKDKKSSHDRKRDSSNNGDVNNFIRKRKDSSVRSSVRNKLAQKNVEMNELYEREYALTKELTNKCKMYKLHNDLYTTTSGRNLEMSVGQIQKSIEECAKEIIQTEHELLTVKNEIKHDISIINNLKRLTLDTDLNACGVPIDIDHVLKPQTDLEQYSEQMLFVDNIYEFCDNNASMLV